MKRFLNVWKPLGLVILMILSASCNSNLDPVVIDVLLAETDLIPEGTAVDTSTGIVYVGSTYKRKIIEIDTEGHVTDFIQQEQDGVWSILGMDIDEKNGILWANTAHIQEVMPLINPYEDRDWLTSVTSFDIRTRKRIKNYVLDHSPAALNDLIIASDGHIYCTESVNNDIYKLDTKADSLVHFVTLDGFTFPNGITSKGNALFVSTLEGIVKVRLSNQKYELISTSTGVDARAIDGLSIYKDYFIGHQSEKVSKFFFDPEISLISRSETIDSGTEFDATTTGARLDNYYYFIVNSQIQSGIDFDLGTIKPHDSLEPIIIRKIRLNQ